jgi:DNA-binding XRE family transcriptional regulator
MMTDAQLKKRDEGRDIGLELLAAAQEMAAGRWARQTTFEALPDGSVRRTVVLADGTVEREEVLVGPQWQLLAARSASGMSQAQFARATGVSVRTLQMWEQGWKKPSGAAQSLLKLVSRHPELLAELAAWVAGVPGDSLLLGLRHEVMNQAFDGFCFVGRGAVGWKSFAVGRYRPGPVIGAADLPAGLPTFAPKVNGTYISCTALKSRA